MARLQELRLAGSNRALLLLALGAGLVAAVLVFVAVNNSGDDKSTAGSAAGDVTAVVVANQDISAGTEITADMVKISDVPADLLVKNAYRDTELVVGDVARVSIAQGEQVTSAKIGLPVPDKGLAGVIPQGMRAVSLEVQEVTAVGGLLLPGDHVDIVAAYRIKRAPGLADDEHILRTETILQNVEVVSVAQEAQKAAARVGTDEADTTDPSYTSGQLPDDVEEQPRAGSITVLLDASQAQVLISIQEYAERVWAVERAFGDTTVVEVTPHDVIRIDGN